MTEHTPGPWERRVNNAGHMQIVRKRKAHETEFEPIALLTNGPVGPNGALIAAAPETAAERDRLKDINADLLAALEATMENGHFHDCSAPYLNRGSVTNAPCTPICVQIRAAHAKARQAP